MNQGLNWRMVIVLCVPPLMWAGNAIVGRVINPLVSPMTLNLLRWGVALVILLPLGGWVLRRDSGLWSHWRRYTVLGLLGVGTYNSLLYLALHTSTAINVTLVASATPVMVLLVGWLGHGQRITRRQTLGAVLSIAGVVLVLCRGDWHMLMAVRLVSGDVYVLIAIAAWAVYSWQLMQPVDPPRIRANWASFLFAQMVTGVAWSSLFAGTEWSLGLGYAHWGWPLVATVVFVSLGPALLAYRCYGLGVQTVGPAITSFFGNLTPLFAALMSAAFLGEPPQLYHLLAFVLIVGGIVASSRRS